MLGNVHLVKVKVDRERKREKKKVEHELYWHKHARQAFKLGSFVSSSENS